MFTKLVGINCNPRALCENTLVLAKRAGNAKKENDNDTECVCHSAIKNDASKNTFLEKTILLRNVVSWTRTSIIQIRFGLSVTRTSFSSSEISSTREDRTPMQCDIQSQLPFMTSIKEIQMIDCLRFVLRSGYLFVLICLFTAANQLSAQWVQTSGPCGGNMNCLARNGTRLFVGTAGAGVFLSDDDGATWTASNPGSTDPNIWAIAVIGTNLFAGTDGGVSLSTDNGLTWNNTSLTGTRVMALAVSGTNLFAGTGAGVSLSKDNGTTWTKVSAGLPAGKYVTALYASGMDLFAGISSGNGAWRSTDNGASWTKVDGFPATVNVFSFFASGSTLFAGSDGIYQSTDGGAHWTWRNIGQGNVSQVYAFAEIGANLFAGTYDRGVIVSQDNGVSWMEVNEGLPSLEVVALLAIGTNLFEGSYDKGGGVALSTNNGTSWSATNYGIYGTGTVALAANGSTIYAGSNAGMFRSTNNGADWTDINNGYPRATVGAILTSGNNLFAGTSNNGDLYHSVDSGRSWTGTNLTGSGVHALLMSGVYLFASTGSRELKVSADNGASWTATGAGSSKIDALLEVGSNIFAGTLGDGVLLSKNNGANWSRINGGLDNRLKNLTVLALAAIGTKIFAGTGGGATGSVFLTTDNGANWKDVSGGMTGYVRSLEVSGNNLFATNGSIGGTDCINLSTDFGNTWQAIGAGISGVDADGGVGCILVNGSNLFAGVIGVWKRPLVELGLTSIARNNAEEMTTELSPNPTNGIVTVRSATSSMSHVTVVNVLGEIVQQIDNPHSSEFTLDLSKLATGMYFVGITSGGSLVSRMIIKN
jgi:hypothetical protein